MKKIDTHKAIIRRSLLDDKQKEEERKSPPKKRSHQTFFPGLPIFARDPLSE